MRNRISAQRRAAVESLEGRQFLSVTLGANLIKNPGAESNVGASSSSQVVAPASWTHNGNATAVKYGVAGFPTSTTPGPSGRGNNFFAGGPGGAESDLFQTIDVSSVGSSTDAGKISYSLSGWLGGFSSQTDNATVFANFQDGSHSFVSQALIGPVTAANRGNVTKLISKSLSGKLPAHTRFVQIQIHFEASSGGYNDGYADNLSFVLTQPAGTGKVSGNVFKDTNGNHSQDGGEAGQSGWMVYIDKNNNGQFDVGETSTLTNSSGNWSFTLNTGSYIIRVQVRAGFYQTAPTALKYNPTVTAGGNILNEKFGVRPIAP